MQKLKKFSINRKRSFLTIINLTVAGVVGITVLMTSMLFSVHFYKESQDQAMQTLQQELEQMNQQIQNYIFKMQTITNQLASDTQLGLAVDRYNSDKIEESLVGKQMMDYIIHKTLQLNTMIENITICTSDSTVQYNYYSMVKGNDISKLKEQQWYKDLMNEKCSNVFIKNTGYDKVDEDETYFLCATKFKTTLYMDRKEEDRIVIVTFRMEEIKKMMENIGETKNINLMLYYLPDNSILSQVIVDKEQLGDENIDLDQQKNDFIILNYKSESNHLRLVGLVEKAAFFDTIEFIQPWILGAAFIILLITIAISIQIFNSISRPMRKVVDALDTIGTTGFRKLDETSSYKETEQLVHTYNEMTDRIQELILNIEKKEKEKRKEEYRVLEAQINPHFIYNTLDAIRWVALINHSKPTAELISSFAKFLRLTLSKGKEMISVAEEMELTKEYIHIMVFRNNYDINVEYVLDDQVKDYLTLKLIIQPFVENCFLHAFDRGKKEKKIIIRTKRKEKNLIMEVEDNGKGFDSWETKVDECVTTGVGLSNVDERIKIWHGDNYGIHIIPLESGTIIQIIQPLLQKGECIYDTSNDN